MMYKLYKLINVRCTLHRKAEDFLTSSSSVGILKHVNLEILWMRDLKFLISYRGTVNHMIIITT
jgi:hypothetical protein